MGINLALGKTNQPEFNCQQSFAQLRRGWDIEHECPMVSPGCTNTNDPAGGPNWWMVDLQQTITIGYVILTNRGDCCGMDDHDSSVSKRCYI